MKSVSSPKLGLILSLALAGLFATPQQATAGTTELKALAKQLNGGVQPTGTTADLITFIRGKTGSELAQAVIALAKLKTTSAAAYAGEALKQADEPDFGATLGQALNADAANLGFIFNAFPTDVTGAKSAAAKAKFIGTASKLAATGAGAFAEWVEGFANQLTATNDEAYAAAKIAAASKTAVGRIIASRTLDADIDTEQERFDLALKAMLPKTRDPLTSGQALSASAQEIARFIGDASTDPVLFARNLVAYSVTTGTKTTYPLLAKMNLIATGTATSNPDKAPDIINSMFSGGFTGTTVDPIFAAAVKGAAKLATTVALVADAEQVERIGETLAAQIGLVQTNSTTGKKKVVGIAQTQVNAIAKGLVLGLTNRTTLPTFSTPALSAQDIINRQLLGANSAAEVAKLLVANSRTNRLDEIGEVGAYLMNAIGKTTGLNVFNGKDSLGNDITSNTKAMAAAKKQAVAIVTGLIKTIITSSAKVNRDVALADAEIGKQKGTLVKAATFQATAAEDVAGSIALTLNSLGAGMNQEIFNAIKLALTTDAKIGIKLAGSSKTSYNVDDKSLPVGELVRLALLAGFNPTGQNRADTIYENGTVAAYAMGPFPTVGGVSEPETDIRIH